LDISLQLELDSLKFNKYLRLIVIDLFISSFRRRPESRGFKKLDHQIDSSRQRFLPEELFELYKAKL
jgi:hypothetical protein